MDLLFDVRKAIAAAAYLCHLNGGKWDVFYILKVLYLSDRFALLTWHRPITGDKFVSMKNGPVLSKVYDLMRGLGSGSEMEAWNKCFHPRSGNTIALKNADVDLDPLSRREIEVLERNFGKWKDVPVGRLAEILHQKLPEWKDPGDSSLPINPRDIFYAANFNEEAVEAIETELSAVQSAKKALQTTS